MPPRRGMQFAHATLAGVLNAAASDDQQARRTIQHTFGTALLVVVLVDVLCALAVLVIECQQQADENDKMSMSHCLRHQLGNEGWKFSVFRPTGSGDLVLLALLRAVWTFLLLWWGVRYGRPACTFCSSNSETTGTEDTTEGLQERLLPETAPSPGEADSRPNPPWYARWYSSKNQTAFIKNCTMGLLFVGCTFFQIYAGLKVALYPPSHQHHNKSFIETTLICLTVLWINLAASLFRTVFAELTREDGVFLPAVHRHPLFYEANRGLSMHWCDICSQRIKRDGCYRCSLCDFDVCVPCSRRSDATTVGENMLRSDRGVRQEQSVDTSSYFVRSLRIARPELPLLTVSFVLLALSSATRLLLPHFQGRIIDTVIPDPNGNVNRSAFTHCIQLYVVIMLVQGAVSTLYSAIFTLVSRRLKFTIRNSLCERILTQDVAYFDGTLLV